MSIVSTEFDEVERLVRTLQGKTIVGGWLDSGDAGFHLKLDDGNFLIISGRFMIGVYRTSEQTLQ